MNNIFIDFYNFFRVLLEITQKLYEWLFEPVNLFGYEFTPIFIGGGLLITIMIIKFVGII